MSTIVQVKLKNTHNEVMTTWVDTRPDLKLGCWITLKEFKPSIRWQVIELYGAVHDAKDFDFHRKWDNNDYTKHEGLKV